MHLVVCTRRLLFLSMTVYLCVPPKATLWITCATFFVGEAQFHSYFCLWTQSLGSQVFLCCSSRSSTDGACWLSCLVLVCGQRAPLGTGVGKMLFWVGKFLFGWLHAVLSSRFFLWFSLSVYHKTKNIRPTPLESTHPNSFLPNKIKVTQTTTWHPGKEFFG